MMWRWEEKLTQQKRIEFRWQKLEDNETGTRKIGLECIENL